TFSCIAECSSALSRPHLLFLSPPSVPARTPSKALALACSLPNVLPSAPPFRCILTASKEDISIGLRRGHLYWGATAFTCGSCDRTSAGGWMGGLACRKYPAGFAIEPS